jgi:hypothetical protein
VSPSAIRKLKSARSEYVKDLVRGGAGWDREDGRGDLARKEAPPSRQNSPKPSSSSFHPSKPTRSRRHLGGRASEEGLGAKSSGSGRDGKLSELINFLPPSKLTDLSLCLTFPLVYLHPLQPTALRSRIGYTISSLPVTIFLAPLQPPMQAKQGLRSVVTVQGPTLSGRSESTRSRQSSSSKSYLFREWCVHALFLRVYVPSWAKLTVPFVSVHLGPRSRHGLHHTGRGSDDAVAVVGAASSAGGNGGVPGAFVRGRVSPHFVPIRQEREH